MGHPQTGKNWKGQEKQPPPSTRDSNTLYFCHTGLFLDGIFTCVLSTLAQIFLKMAVIRQIIFDPIIGLFEMK